MPRYRRKRKYKRRRTSRLADKRINTLFEKRAKEIAQKEDRKNLRKYVHVTQIVSSLYTDWYRHPQQMPLPTQWQLCTGETFYNKMISDLGGNVGITELSNLDAAEQSQLELRIHGIQVHGAILNNSTYPVRVEARLIYIPNANAFTTQPNDYLTPRQTMFMGKDGLGGLQYRGYDYRALGALDATGVPVKYKNLARKAIFAKSNKVNGTQGAAGAQTPIVLQLPMTYKRFTLTKYFKKPKRAFVRGSQAELSNGNYYLVWWSDGASTQQTFSIIASMNLQYSIKAPMNDDIAP